MFNIYNKTHGDERSAVLWITDFEENKQYFISKVPDTAQNE